MTEPSNRSAVVPFAGLPAIAPPSAADLGQAADSVVPALRRDAYESLNDTHFINAGIHHADMLIERLINGHRLPDVLPLDSSGALRAYEIATGRPATPQAGDEQRERNQRTYITALCNQLARQANNYSSGSLIARDGSESTRSLQDKGLLPSPGLQPPERVSQLADEMRGIARSLSNAAGVVCGPLQDYDWARSEEQGAEEAASKLAVLVDKLAVLTALPQLDVSQRTERGISTTARVAAQIATLYAASTPSAVAAALDGDRLKILGNLLPDVSLRSSSGKPVSPQPLASALRRAADRYLLRLSGHPSVQEASTEAEHNARAEAAREIARIYMRNPEAVGTLQPVQAGLVRELIDAVEATPGLARQLRKSNLTVVRPHINASHATSPRPHSRPPS